MKRIPTETQSEIIHRKHGLFTVLACPGSGKTFTVAARSHRLLSIWKPRHQGIAAISFTNVAWEEIEEYLVSDFGMDSFPGYPHFLGTIDSFINTYIFLPFGYLVMGCRERPILTGPPFDNHEPIGNWLYWKSQICNRNRCKLNQFSFNRNGKLIHLKNAAWGESCPHNLSRPCIQHKKTFNSKGFSTQADANYFALKIIKDYPPVAEALAVRFPVIMVDEAQDTSRIQMDILDLLIKHGVEEMMLVGDPNQAIYEWREAEPHLFLQKWQAWNENSVKLTENWRSSQRICNLASKLSSTAEVMKAANPSCAEYRVNPKILGYSDLRDLPDLVNWFIELCKSYEIHDSGINILTRSNELLNDIRQGTIQSHNLNPWRNSLSWGIANSKYLYDNENFKEAFGILQREICKHRSGAVTFKISDLEELCNEEGFGNWRAHLFEILSSLPTTDSNLSHWVSEANEVLRTINNAQEDLIEIKRNSSRCRYGDLLFDKVFGRPEIDSSKSECYLGTVHSAKGKTLDAVMLVLRKKAGKGGNYANLLGNDLQKDEELRIVYVAITRARRLLVIAVPSADVVCWKQYCNESYTILE